MNGKLIALALAILALPVAAAQPLSTTSAVEGHTVFARVDPGGSSFAAIAGIVECQVVWFNNQVLFQVDPGTTGMCGDARYIYAYPSHAPDPRGNPTLESTGRMWDFSDPNGASWHVAEFRYQQLDVSVDQHLGLPDALPDGVGTDQAGFVTWVVETGPRVYDPTLQDYYNFVTLVDTSKVVLGEPGDLPQGGTPDAPAGAPDTPVTGSGSSHASASQSSRSFVTLSLGGPPTGWAA